ncbi:AIPR family protein [Candidatus Parcubacteria bacterium]|nr:AIPR family protein [Candidatus Parcubacteria bacterium]
MSKRTFEFEFSQARTISRNLYFYNTEEKESIIKTHFLFILLKNLPRELPTGPNPRQADLKAKPCRQMFETLEKEPELFTDCNRGLFLIAEKVYYPNQDNKKSAVIDFGKDEDGNIKGGLVDGNHSYRVLEKAINDETLSDLPVFITIIEGADQFATQLARARNTSVQVKETSIANLDKEFEPIKKSLRSYAEKIIWSENENVNNEKAVFSVEDLMAFMTAMNLDLYDNDHHPTIAYTGTSTCFNKWKNKKNRHSYEKLYFLLPSIVEIYEHLYKKYEDYAKEGGVRKFGLFNGVERERGKGKNRKKIVIKLPFTEEIIHYKIANGFILPIFSALRFLLEDENGNYKWAIDPRQFLDKHAPKLVSKILDAHSNENSSNPNKTGKSKMLWENIAQSVINYSLQEKLNNK